jgi:mRNA interferase RelE/StbE
MYAIEFTRSAVKALATVPPATRALLLERLETLSADPFRMTGVKKLVGIQGYRLRIGDWRVIFDIERDRLVIRVLKIGTRGKVYT